MGDESKPSDLLVVPGTGAGTKKLPVGKGGAQREKTIMDAVDEAAGKPKPSDADTSSNTGPSGQSTDSYNKY